jgi:signal transduction histidine kinase
MAILEASGAKAVLIWTSDGRALTSRGWEVDADALSALRSRLEACDGPTELTIDDAILGRAGRACPDACERFCYVSAGGDGGALFGFAVGSDILAGKHATAVGRLAALAAASVLDDGRLARAEHTAVSEIVSGIAHDIGTPLNVISGYAESILMHTPEEAPGRKQLSAIVEQTRRIGNMVRQMLDIVRPSHEYAVREQPLAQFVGDVFHISSHMLRRREVRCRPDATGAGDGAVSGDLPRWHEAMFSVLRGAALVAGPKGQLVLRAVSNDEVGTGIVLEATDSAGSPANLSSVVADGTSDDLLFAEHVLEEHGGGLDRVAGDGGPDPSKLFVRIASPAIGS